ncbi:hypothetical protein [Sphingomonas abietis]|uniref:Uncharacterized protein n=1 Tax=Sphingomonas abietis TaxID=3012344 RepID=A0ABY7NNE5_9SPHN|nr:hypothetical protein [Sphingomonas abietis]WBO23050.1 hypothetical protein PBT88_02615 [Sphingomonas abietis]
MAAEQDPRLDKALDSISVAPPKPADGETTDQELAGEQPEVREAHDAEHHEELTKDPSDEEGKLDVGLDESFPSSDPASSTQPGHSDPAPSSGYDEDAEKAREKAGQ